MFIVFGDRILPVILRLPLRHIPHLQEHHGKALYRVSLQHDGRILPVAKAHLAVDVLVRQIYTAGKGRMAVYNHNLPVIPVILISGQGWLYRRKHLTADSLFLQHPGIMVRKKHEAAHAVIHNPDLHTLLYLLLQHLQDTVPHVSPLYDKIFHENKMPGRLKLPHESLKLVLPQRKVFHMGVGVGGIPRVILHVINQMAASPAGFPDSLLYFPVLLQVSSCVAYVFFQTPGHKLCLELHLHKYIQQDPEHRNHQNRYNPGHLKAGINRFIENINDDCRAQKDGYGVYNVHVLFQPPEGAKQDSHLYGHKQHHKGRPSKYNPE